MATDNTENQGSGAEAANPPWLRAYPSDIAWDQEFPATSLPKMFDDAVTTYPKHPCTRFLGKSMSYREIGRLVDATATGLQAAGVQKGTRVGLFLPNCPTFIIYYFAILKAGGTVVNFNPLYTVEELAGQAADSGTDIMITLDLKALFEKVEALISQDSLRKAVIASFAELLPPAKSFLFRMLKAREIAHPHKSAVADSLLYDADLRRSSHTFHPVGIDPYSDIAVLQYTGGTTGTPKGAMLTHANLVINVQQVSVWNTNLTPGEGRMLGILPFFHVFAMTVVMNYSIRTGAEIVMMPRFVLNDALKLITQSKPTLMPAVPSLFTAMLNHPKLKNFDLSSIEFCMSGGAPLPIQVKRDFESLVPGCKVVEGYGLSETSPVATCNPVDGPIKEGSIGMPLPGTTISLRDLDDPTKEVAHGEKGEICISGPQVMLGYWNKPTETAAAFVGDFFRTGDVARMDDDGMLFIEDRIKDLIICNGYNVYPRRIEDAIYTLDTVEEVTVIGIPDEKRGEAPKAFIKLKAGKTATPDEILEHLSSKLSKIEMPAIIEFRDELPKTMIGKLSKKELKQELEKDGA